MKRSSVTISVFSSRSTWWLPWEANPVAIISRFEIILGELGWLLVGLGIYVSRCWREWSQATRFLHHEEQ